MHCLFFQTVFARTVTAFPSTKLYKLQVTFHVVISLFFFFRLVPTVKGLLFVGHHEKPFAEMKVCWHYFHTQVGGVTQVYNVYTCGTTEVFKIYDFDA